ncbi:hypothetical protein D0866_11704 [Hortaea werneckii]|uniref:Uncharacterized protein n=1 Tax=Hortaea werneckii TaxID=91943 RepID=A0A3M7A6P1_HORWE|nr:hypothetical protein D0866_11704 [Hortaea werneckii]
MYSPVQNTGQRGKESMPASVGRDISTLPGPVRCKQKIPSFNVISSMFDAPRPHVDDFVGEVRISVLLGCPLLKELFHTLPSIPAKLLFRSPKLL